jgi:hypothetical protein
VPRAQTVRHGFHFARPEVRHGYPRHLAEVVHQDNVWIDQGELFGAPAEEECLGQQTAAATNPHNAVMQTLQAPPELATQRTDGARPSFFLDCIRPAAPGSCPWPKGNDVHTRPDQFQMVDPLKFGTPANEAPRLTAPSLCAEEEHRPALRRQVCGELQIVAWLQEQIPPGTWGPKASEDFLMSVPTADDDGNT